MTNELFALSAKERLFKYIFNNHVSVRELERTGELDRLAAAFGLEKADYSKDPTLQGCLKSSYSLARPDGRSLFVDRCLRYQPPHLCQLSCIEMLYVYSGSCKCIVKHTEYSFQAGDLCIFPPFPRMSYVINHDEDILFDVTFWPETFCGILMAQPHNTNRLFNYFHHIFSDRSVQNDSASFITIRTEGRDDIGELFIKMWKENRIADPHSDLMQVSLFNQICVEIMRKYPDSILLPSNISQQSSTEAIVSYIEHNSSALTLREAAEHFNYTPSHLCRLIKRNTGRTFNDILHEARLRRASVLLKNRDWSVDSIASHVGYTSLSTFYRQFGRQFDTSPAEYRLCVRANAPPATTANAAAQTYPTGQEVTK